MEDDENWLCDDLPSYTKTEISQMVAASQVKLPESACALSKKIAKNAAKRASRRLERSLSLASVEEEDFVGAPVLDDDFLGKLARMSLSTPAQQRGLHLAEPTAEPLALREGESLLYTPSPLQPAVRRSVSLCNTSVPSVPESPDENKEESLLSFGTSPAWDTVKRIASIAAEASTKQPFGLLDESIISGYGSRPITPMSPTVVSPSAMPTPGITSTPEFPERTAIKWSPESIIQSDSDDDFQDASDDFIPEVKEHIAMTSSFSVVESLLNMDMRPDDTENEDTYGQSCIRANMTQSLVRVEEEDSPPMRTFTETDHSKTIPRHTRSASVSPRVVEQMTATSQQQQSPATHTPQRTTGTATDQQSPLAFLSARNGTVRRSLGPQIRTPSSSRYSQSPLTQNHTQQTTPTSRVSRAPRSMSKSVMSPAPVLSLVPPRSAVDVQNVSSSPSQVPASTISPRITPLRSSPGAHGGVHTDMQTIQDRVRQQEEALREEYMREMQQLDRKHSWQGENGVPSPNSSVGSLASSKSVDIGSLTKTPTSRIPAPSRLPQPRKSGIPQPRKGGASSRCTTPSAASLVPKPGVDSDDDCF